jgi:hypothetical protein
MSSNLQPSGFCCFHPRIALVALSHIDTVVDKVDKDVDQP